MLLGVFVVVVAVVVGGVGVVQATSGDQDGITKSVGSSEVG